MTLSILMNFNFLNYFFGDISRYPLLLLARRLRSAPPPRCGVAAAIAAAVQIPYFASAKRQYSTAMAVLKAVASEGPTDYNA